MDYDEDPDYLDIDDILVNTQMILCRFLLHIPVFEYVPGQETLLPFWLAKTLYTYSMIDIILPSAYAPKGRELMDTEQNMYNLRREGPYFYQFGRALLNLRREKGNNLAAFNEEGQRNKYRREEGETLEHRREIAEFLMTTFHVRRSVILNFSIKDSKISSQLSTFESKLDNTELKLCRLARQQLQDLKKWDSRNTERVTTSEISTMINKRRKVELRKEDKEH